MAAKLGNEQIKPEAVPTVFLRIVEEKASLHQKESSLLLLCGLMFQS